MAKKGEVADIVVKNMSEAQVNSLRSLVASAGLAAEVQDELRYESVWNFDAFSIVLDYFFARTL